MNQQVNVKQVLDKIGRTEIPKKIEEFRLMVNDDNLADLLWVGLLCQFVKAKLAIVDTPTMAQAQSIQMPKKSILKKRNGNNEAQKKDEASSIEKKAKQDELEIIDLA